MHALKHFTSKSKVSLLMASQQDTDYILLLKLGTTMH